MSTRLTHNAWTYAKRETCHSAYCMCRACYAVALEYDQRSACVCGLLPAEYSVPAETSNMVCDTCGRTYKETVEDAPSNYLTDEAREEMGAAMDAENATRFTVRHAIIGNDVAQYEVFDANLSGSVAVATFWEFPGIDDEWPSAREMAETFVSAWNAK